MIKSKAYIGVKSAAAQLGIPYYTLSGWRNNRKKHVGNYLCGSGHKLISENPSEQCILSLVMRDNVKKKLSIDAFNTITKRYNLDGCILHSDRDSQYTSEAFRKTLSKASVTQSLSGVDNCYDNSCMEGFFATLKKGLRYRIPTYRMKKEDVKSFIFRYVFIYYNQKRIYTANPGCYPLAVYRLMQEKNLLAA